LLIERAAGRRSLAAMAQGRRDDEASRILCAVAAKLHAPRDRRPPRLVPLSRWFAALTQDGPRHGGILGEAAATACALLAAPREPTVLHGDLHHGNVLDFAARGWLAIDPKGLIGERAFEFANLLRNPDEAVAMRPGRFARQVQVIARAAHVEPTRLLRWVLALAGLSACWILADGGRPEQDLAIAALAAAELHA
jgi:streptomycin 6-kinase